MYILTELSIQATNIEANKEPRKATVTDKNHSRVLTMRRQISHTWLKNVIVTTFLMESNRPESSSLRSSSRKGLRTPLDSRAIPILPFQSTSIRSRSGKHTHARIHVDGRTRTRVPQAHKRWSELRPTADCRTCEFTYVRHACTGWARHTNGSEGRITFVAKSLANILRCLTSFVPAGSISSCQVTFSKRSTNFSTAETRIRHSVPVTRNLAIRQLWTLQFEFGTTSKRG